MGAVEVSRPYSGLEGQLEQWRGSADHSGALLAVSPPSCSLGDSGEGEKRAGSLRELVGLQMRQAAHTDQISV